MSERAPPRAVVAPVGSADPSSSQHRHAAPFRVCALALLALFLGCSLAPLVCLSLSPSRPTLSLSFTLCVSSPSTSPLSPSLPSPPPPPSAWSLLGAARISSGIASATAQLDLLSVSVISPVISALFLVSHPSLRKQSACGHRGDFFTSNSAKRSTTTVATRVWRASRLASAQCARTFDGRAEPLAPLPLGRLCHFAWRRHDPRYQWPFLSSFPLACVALRPCLGAAFLERRPGSIAEGHMRARRRAEKSFVAIFSDSLFARRQQWALHE